MDNAVQTPWPHPGPVAIVVDPARKKPVIRFVFAALTVFVLGIITEEELVTPWAKKKDVQNDVNRMGAIMLKHAHEGKPDAVVWVAKFMPEKDSGSLEKLALSGHGEALWILAGVRASKGQTNEADLLVKKSAEAGYPLAVKKVNGVLFHRVEVLR